MPFIDINIVFIGLRQKFKPESCTALFSVLYSMSVQTPKMLSIIAICNIQ